MEIVKRSEPNTVISNIYIYIYTKPNLNITKSKYYLFLLDKCFLVSMYITKYVQMGEKPGR